MRSYQLNRKKDTLSETVQPYWLSISDLMAGVLIVFILFFVLKINAEIKLRRIFEEMYKVKEHIVGEVKDAFENDENIEVLEDGTVRFFIDDTTKQWFVVGESELMEAGKTQLSDFTRKYVSILFSPRYRDFIDKIEIEGHTDSSGKHETEQEKYLYNLHLSQERAYSVAEFIHRNVMLSRNPETNSLYKAMLRERLTASGRSFIDVIKDNAGEESSLLSRRVEFKFRLPMEKKYLEFRDSN